MASPTTTGFAPAGTAPPGGTYGGGDGAAAQQGWLGLSTVLMALMLVFVGTRVYVKARVSREFSADDWTCFAATAGTVWYYAVVMTLMVDGHFGAHMQDVPVAALQAPGVLAAAFMAPWLAALVLFLIKISFVLLYMGVFGVLRGFRRWLQTAAGLMALFYLGMTVSLLAVAVPRGGNSWFQQFLVSYRDVSAEYTVALVAVDLAWDIFLLVLPALGVMQLHMSARRKLGVAAVFATGLLACAAAIASIATRIARLGDDGDFTFDTYPTLITTFAQLPIGVVCLCMPSMAAFLRHKVPSRGATDRRVQSVPLSRTVRSLTAAAPVDYESLGSQRRLADSGGEDGQWSAPEHVT